MHWNPEQIDSLLRDMASSLESMGSMGGADDAGTTALVGIESGGAWVARALNERLSTPLPLGFLDANFYRDDFEKRGLKKNIKPSKLPFDVEGAHLILVDDVLMTGRTIRAAMNELFDFGRPASIRLMVLFDIGRRELPIRADICGEVLSLPADQRVELSGPDQLEASVQAVRNGH